MILVSGTTFPGMLDWDVPWQKVIPYTTAAAGVIFGIWAIKNADKVVQDRLVKGWQNEGVYLSYDPITGERKGVVAGPTEYDLKTKKTVFYYDHMSVGTTFNLFQKRNDNPLITIQSRNNPLNDSTKNINAIASVTGTINTALFRLCVKDISKSYPDRLNQQVNIDADRWYIQSERSNKLRFKSDDHVQNLLSSLQEEVD